jgi:hypothetical protein
MQLGEPMDRSRLFFPPTSEWEKAFPTLEDAIIHYIESDFSGEERKGIVSLRRQGGILPCGNPLCFRGGYELDREVDRMIHEGVLEKTMTLHCPGDEGTPKRHRGDDCERSIRATLKLKPKSVA